MRKWLKHLKNQKGLTLIELLAVVVILGIIAAIAVPAIGNIIDSSKDDAHRSNALLIMNAAKLGIVAGDVKPGTNNNITLQELVDAGYLDAVPANPSIEGKSYNGSTSYVNVDESGKYLIRLAGSGIVYFDNKTEAEINDGEDPNTP